MHRSLSIAMALLVASGCGVQPTRSPAATPRDTPSRAPIAVALELPAQASQGALVIGRAAPDARVRVGDREVRVAGDGRFAFGIARDASAAVTVRAEMPGAAPQQRVVNVERRDWPVERIAGVPPSTVDPPPAIAARIREEQARVASARLRDDARTDFLQPFVRPVDGRISGRFGNQRVYNGRPGAPHSGMDIAAARGTPVRAPAAGTITFADPGLYLTGGTLVLDHGHGISSNFLHLARIDVRVGQPVAQGDVIGTVGATGRATGPHLHWGMNWFETRLDPMLVLSDN